MLLAGCASLAGAERSYEVAGTVEPAAQASVSLHGATSPFSTAVLSDGGGRFRFSKLAAGQYTLAAFVPAIFFGQKDLKSFDASATLLFLVETAPALLAYAFAFLGLTSLASQLVRSEMSRKTSGRPPPIGTRCTVPHFSTT